MIAKPQMWWPGIDRQHPMVKGAVAVWPFWEGAGGSLRDVMKGHDGTLSNMDAANWSGTETGGGLNFDGSSNNTITVPYHAELNLFNGVTIAARFRATLGVSMVLISQPFNTFHGNPFYEWTLYVSSGGEINFRMGSDTATSSAMIAGGVWETVVLTADGVNRKWYFNGRLTETAATTTLPGNTNSQGVRIGTNPSDNEDFNGDIDIIKLFPFAVRAEWVAQWHADPYAALRIPSITRRHVAAAPGGLSIPVAMHSYRRRRVYA